MLLATTFSEVDDRLKAGCTQISSAELIYMLKLVGYKICPSTSFDYTNTSNAIIYNARSISIIEADTGLSFGHIDARKDGNFRKLQEIRMEYLVFEKNRVWEL